MRKFGNIPNVSLELFMKNQVVYKNQNAHSKIVLPHLPP